MAVFDGIFASSAGTGTQYRPRGVPMWAGTPGTRHLPPPGVGEKKSGSHTWGFQLTFLRGVAPPRGREGVGSGSKTFSTLPCRVAEKILFKGKFGWVGTKAEFSGMLDPSLRGGGISSCKFDPSKMVEKTHFLGKICTKFRQGNNLPAPFLFFFNLKTPFHSFQMNFRQKCL